LKNIIASNPDLTNLISINKITNQTKNFSIIGLVREKDEENKSITIEDTTGEIEIFISDTETFHEIVVDDVLGVVCTKIDRLSAERIIWPDVPLRRSINKTDEDVYCLFVSGFHMEAENFNKKAYENFLEWLRKNKYDKLYLFVLGGVSSKKEDVINFFASLPTDSFKIFVSGEINSNIDVLLIKQSTLLKIEGKLIFLIYNEDTLSKYTKLWDGRLSKVMLNLLKKRQLDPVFDKQIYEEDQVLDTVPDVFVSQSSNEPALLNYKGTTILTAGDFASTPSFWLMNLRTREAIKIDFA
jgi:DNA polymerase II small subunit/DNA polymerase delta subunit B